MATGLGIDIGAEHIKVVQANVSSRGVTVTAALKLPRKPQNLDLPDMPVEDDSGSLVVPETLGLELKHVGLRRTGTLGISGREVSLKYLATPPAPPEKLKMFIDMEIGGKLTARGGGDTPAITYDYRLLNIPAGGLRGDLVIMAGLCKNEYLFGVTAALKTAQINAQRITPSCFGLVNAYLRTQQIQEKETVVLVDIGHELLEIAILEENRLYFARSAPGGGRKFTAALDKVLKLGPAKCAAFKHERARLYPEGAQIPNKQELMFQAALKEGAEGIAGAIRSSIMFCRTQAKLPKLDYNRVFLSGGGARLNGLREYLEKKLARPVQILDLQKNLDMRRLDAASARCFDGEVSDMSIALGLAIIDADPSSFHFSLVPEKIVRQQIFWRKTVYGIAAGVVLMASVIPPIQNSQKAVNVAEEAAENTQALCVKAEEQKRGFEKLVKDNQQRSKQIDYYARQTRLSRLYLQLFSKIRAEMPPNIMLTYFGPPSDVVDAAGAGAGRVGMGMGTWTAVDEPVKNFLMRGYYQASDYPEAKLRDAWDGLRKKLLEIPGITSAGVDMMADEEGPVRSGLKTFQARISLQDESKPLAVFEAGTGAAPRTAPKTPAPPPKKAPGY
ncbi:MAG TPA: pilus assembly protein PilM [Planctomycetota bacterium]|jgi:Tfp pilus assembly PilM family ATPase